jgi:hypothetical protein
MFAKVDFNSATTPPAWAATPECASAVGATRAADGLAWQQFCHSLFSEMYAAMRRARARFAALPPNFAHAVNPRRPAIQTMPVAIVPHALNKSEATHQQDEHHQALQEFVHRGLAVILTPRSTARPVWSHEIGATAYIHHSTAT